MQEQITIASLNCQGLGGKGKRKDVLNFLKQKNIIFTVFKIHIL